MRHPTWLALLAACALAGCGASTGLDPYPDGPPPTDAIFDGTSDVVSDVPVTSCSTNADCAGHAGTPYCDTTSHTCVACLPSPDTCAVGTYCEPTIHRCEPGCQNDAACTTPTPRCLTTAHLCVQCLMGSDCPAGEACVDSMCVATCGPTGMCPVGDQCCGASCANLASDPDHCGACGIACPTVPNGVRGCVGSGCSIAGCNGGFADCNHVVMDGCEVTLASDANNCGACGVHCATGQTCTGGVCAGVCPPCPAGASCCGSACFNLQTDVNNCGGCGTHCAAGQTCAAGVCTGGNHCPTVPCAPGSTCCAGTCLNTTTDVNNCGACGVVCAAGNTCMGGACCNGTACSMMVCSDGLTDCSNVCVNTTDDPANCGACGIRCGTGQSCIGSVCVSTCNGGPACGTGQSCCGTAGCVSTQSDSNNCGGCGIRCATGTTCVGGTCQAMMGCLDGPLCTAGQMCCPTGCRDTQTDLNNCGACGNVCTARANQTATCNSGGCIPVCDPGFANCDHIDANGCEASTLTDPNNCGACFHACGAGSVCMMGTCIVVDTCGGGPACTAPAQCCGTACANITTDPNNCGACGTSCARPHAIAQCTGAACSFFCSSGFADCDGNAANGCEAVLSTDPNNCGGCGIPCGTGATCTGGACVPVSTGSEGAFLPVANPTYLSPGIHNFTTITVPTGAVVYVAGSGPLSGTLDLRATGHVQIDGTIDVSGGPGTQSIVASTSTQEGRAGTGGYTGRVLSAVQPTLSCEFVAGVPGPDGAAVAGTAGTCNVISTTSCLTRMDMGSFIWASPAANYGGGAGVFTGYRAYGSGGGGFAGGAPGALGVPSAGEADCTGASGGGGAVSGQGGNAGVTVYNGAAGNLGNTQCAGTIPGVSAAWVGGGGGGSIGTAAATDLAAASTFYPGSGGGGGSADYLQRPAFGGTSGGGGGGGALRLWTTADMSITGQLLANGGAGGDAYIGTPAGAMCDPQPGSGGGGGSGGLIFLQSPTLSVSTTAVISAQGGAGGAASVFATGGSGGAGGLGRIRVSATTSTCTLSGMLNPPPSSGCTPIAATPGRAYVGNYPN